SIGQSWLVSTLPIACGTRVRPSALGSNVQDPCIVDPGYASPARSHLDKIHVWKANRVAGPGQSTHAVNLASHLILVSHVETVARPDPGLGCGTANVERDNDTCFSFRRVGFSCHSPGYWSRLDYSGGLLDCLGCEERPTI